MDTLITLHDRALKADDQGDAGATEIFTSAADNVFSLLETVSGETIFDAVGIERDVTHRFTVDFIAGVTAETWITLEDMRLDILTVEDLEERHEFLLLRATNRGASSKAATGA